MSGAASQQHPSVSISHGDGPQLQAGTVLHNSFPRVTKATKHTEFPTDSSQETNLILHHPLKEADGFGNRTFFRKFHSYIHSFILDHKYSFFIFHWTYCYSCWCSLLLDDIVSLLAFFRLSSDFSILIDMWVSGKSYYPTATPHYLGQQKSQDIFKDTWFRQSELLRIPHCC